MILKRYSACIRRHIDSQPVVTIDALNGEKNIYLVCRFMWWWCRSCVSICKVVIYQPKYMIPQNYPKTRKNSHTHNPPTILWNTYKFIITPAICKSRCLTILFESVRICYIREVYRLRALFVYIWFVSSA